MWKVVLLGITGLLSKPAVKLFSQANALVISNAAFVSSTDLAAQRFTHPLNESGGETLDRVHAAMLLQGSGRTNGLRALLRNAGWIPSFGERAVGIVS